jgi:eukaryotic-like serine/threonine-protein kinase
MSRPGLGDAELPGPGDVIAGRYAIIEELQGGGMGVVMAARHVVLDRPVAVKLLRPEHAAHSDARERFLREARLAAQLVSEHTARVIDVGETNRGIPYLVMERLEGRSLAEILDDRALGVSEAVDFTLQALEAVAEAHRRGMVHRDLKPGNLFLIQGTDGCPRVKVLDFGIAKSLGDDLVGKLTSVGDVLGTPSYMSPEQIRDSSAVDHRSDIWNLGCTLYELLTREPPFQAAALLSLCAKVIGDAPPSLCARNEEVPTSLEAVVSRCLEKSPARRYPDVGALAEALEPFASNGGRLLVPRIRGILGRGQTAPTPAARSTRPRDARPPMLDTLAISATWLPRRPPVALWVGVAAVAAVVVGSWVLSRQSTPPTAVPEPPEPASTYEPPALSGKVTAFTTGEAAPDDVAWEDDPTDAPASSDPLLPAKPRQATKLPPQAPPAPPSTSDPLVDRK